VDDLDALQGEWRQVGYERNGVKEPLDELDWHPRVTFVDSTFTVTLADGSISIKGTFKLDATQSPKHIEFTDIWGRDAGKTFLGIYTLLQDRFVFCASEPGLERPQAFTTQVGQVLRINERIVK
jgi:uncharacterized protein (TIGR03067 family)